MKTFELTCSVCDKIFPGDGLRLRCPDCGEGLDTPIITEGKIRASDKPGQRVLERYADFFPYLDLSDDPGLGEGMTPLIRDDVLAAEVGVAAVYLKNETVNPTWSFKDRGTATGIVQAKNLGYKKVGTASTGNMAVSVAAFAGRAGMKALVLVSDKIAEEKLNPIAVHGPTLVKIKGDYSKMYDTALEIGGKLGIAFINSDATMRVAGYKTMAYEICEQCDFDVPDYVIVPNSAGGQFRGIFKGFLDFYRCGLIEKLPVMVAAQASGCSPVAAAFEKGENRVSRFENPSTIAGAITNPLPPSGNGVLRILREYGGLAVTESDESMLASQKRLAERGLFVQPESALTLAVLKKLVAKGQIKAGSKVVCVLSGGGLKFTAALGMQQLKAHSCRLEEAVEFISEVF
ncbi:MAG: threonine synthase [Treponema sp.]|nr:threonine synthase [Treponema sp.]